MTRLTRLYEPAATTGEFDALWDIRDGRAFLPGHCFDALAVARFNLGLPPDGGAKSAIGMVRVKVRAA